MRPPTPAALERPAWIPARGRIVIDGENEASLWGQAWLGDRPVANLSWSREGRLLYEKALDADGKGHGLEIERDDEGRVTWTAQWVHGEMHGLVMQLDERGRPEMVTEFVRGRGTDIWMGGGKVSEMRELVDGKLHGVVRWGDPRRPWREEHHAHGQRHGVFREWDDTGTLRKGFPRFFVKDERVSRRAYREAQAADPSLPRYHPDDDDNARTLPPVVKAALVRARELRRALALLEQLRRRTGQDGPARRPMRRQGRQD